jgi:hypothetical protein
MNSEDARKLAPHYFCAADLDRVPDAIDALREHAQDLFDGDDPFRAASFAHAAKMLRSLLSATTPSGAVTSRGPVAPPPAKPAKVKHIYGLDGLCREEHGEPGVFCNQARKRKPRAAATSGEKV